MCLYINNYYYVRCATTFLTNISVKYCMSFQKNDTKVILYLSFQHNHVNKKWNLKSKEMNILHIFVKWKI